MGVQGQDVKEPWTPYVAMPEDAAEVRKGVSLEIPGSPALEPPQCMTKDRQVRQPHQ